MSFITFFLIFLRLFAPAQILLDSTRDGR